MASGETTSGSLADSLPSIIADARIVREFEGVWKRTCDVRDQAKGTGLNWQEISLGQLTASDVTETTTNENYQQLVDTIFQIEPTMTQIALKITDRTYRKIAAVVESKIGSLAGNAMARKKDEDYLALFSACATTASPGSGNPLSFGHIAAAKNNITSNVTEPSMAECYTVLHGFQIKDIQDEVLAGVGTYTIPSGMTEEVFKRGFMGTVAGSNVFEDGNITVDATPNANGATHSKEGIVMVLGMGIKQEQRRDPSFGGGADEIFLTDEYGLGERLGNGATQTWCYLHLSDATAPTS
jgi:hypothetical protein